MSRPTRDYIAITDKNIRKAWRCMWFGYKMMIVVFAIVLMFEGLMLAHAELEQHQIILYVNDLYEELVEEEGREQYEQD